VQQGIAQSSPRASFQPYSSIQGYIIGRRLTFTSTSTQPAILHSIKTRASVIPDLFRTLNLSIVFGNGVPLRRGMDERDPSTVLAILEGLQESGPITFTDWFGNVYDAEVEPGIRELAKESEANRWMILAQVSVTLRSEAFGQVLVYGVGSWGAGYVYGRTP
jgi:hypothetical protein